MEKSRKHSIPNLFIIGAMKSGTTSLHEYLSTHPDVYMSRIKEPGFFAECVKYYPKNFEWYMSLFKDVKDEKIIGESSTHYTKLPLCEGVVQRLWEHNPEARFIYIMRHPVKRTISHYWYNVKCGGEHRDIITALKKNQEYISYSDYAYQLTPYIERFDKENILTLTFEDLTSRPDSTLKNVFNWLGVRSDISVSNIDQKYNALPETFKRVKGWGLLYGFRNSVLWNKVAPWVPRNIRSAGARLTLEDAVKSTDMDEEVNELLHSIFIEKVKNLELLLSKNFDVWKY